MECWGDPRYRSRLHIDAIRRYRTSVTRLNGGLGASRILNKQHEMLLEKFKIEGFPTVLILNPQGKGIVRDGYQRGGPAKYVEFIKGVITADKAK